MLSDEIVNYLLKPRVAGLAQFNDLVRSWTTQQSGLHSRHEKDTFVFFIASRTALGRTPRVEKATGTPLNRWLSWTPEAVENIVRAIQNGAVSQIHRSGYQNTS